MPAVVEGLWRTKVRMTMILITVDRMHDGAEGDKSARIKHTHTHKKTESRKKKRHFEDLFRKKDFLC